MPTFLRTLVRYETHLWNHLDGLLRGGGVVSLATLSALGVVHDHATSRVQEVSVDLGITVGAASKLVDRLERAGLVERTANPLDRRSSLLELTPAGRAAHAEATALLDAALDEHLGGEDVRAVEQVLGRLLHRLTAATSSATPAASATPSTEAAR